MAVQAQRVFRGYGTKLLLNNSEVAALSSIGGPSASAEVTDVFYLDSPDNARESIATLLDYGEVSIEGGYIPSDSGQSALKTLMQSLEIGVFKIVYAPGINLSVEFSGFVTAFEVTAASEEIVNFSATIRVSGAPTETTTTV